ncbi:MAG: hypothetical protein LWW93_17720 [Hyphomicrobiales bacterium]|nr:hypothetical protein [Hyphomicrobiales bacterium]
MSSTSSTASRAQSFAERVGSAALRRGRFNPDFSQPFALGDDDRAILTMRGLDEAKQTAAATLWSSARSAVASGRGLEFLKGLDAGSLAVLQQAACLADPIRPGAVSEEGAENLLLKPTEAIDRNRDGLVEVGVGRLIAFPPPDASPALRSAWTATVDTLDSGDAAMLALELASPSIPIDGGAPQFPDFGSPDFDWTGWMERLFEGAAVSAPYNDAEANRRTFARLSRFEAALKDNGLA